jgi:hypothetical protein
MAATDRISDECGMEFAAERSTYPPPNSREPDRPSELRGAKSEFSGSKQRKGSRSNSSKQQSKQDKSPEQTSGEAEFWGKGPEPTEQTKRELRVFKRVHLQAPSPFMQTIHHIDKSHFRNFDIEHVRALFPEAPDYLVERLGKAISRRRQYISYLQKRALNLMSHDADSQTKAEKTDPIEKARSQTSTAATEPNLETGLPSFSMSESQTSYTEFTYGHLDWRPPLPRAAHKKEIFECPICFHLVFIQTTARWRYLYKPEYVADDAKLIYRRHVWRDLHPYLCTVDGCDTADRIYQSRHAWFEHEVETHYSDTEANLSTSCVLCGVRLTSFARLRRHMGNHQQRLAVFALSDAMRDHDDDSGDDEEYENHEYFENSTDSNVYIRTL